MNTIKSLFSTYKQSEIIIEDEDIFVPSKKDEDVMYIKPDFDYSNDDEDIDYKTIMAKLKTPVYTINNKSMYVLDLCDIKHMNLLPYRHQRASNSEHINVLKEGILKTGYLYHPIILCHIPKRGEITIIDGQHRFKALKDIVGKRDDIKVQLEVIKIDDDDSIVMDVYRNVNTCEPIDMKRIVLEQDYVNFIQKLKKIYNKKVIGEYKNKRKHYIVESDIKKEFMERNLLVKYPVNVLLSRIDDINKTLKEQNILLNRLTQKELELCEKSGFWLGTDFPKWINKI
jgi:hypothetical protein